jgi:hypothetical protein
MDPFLDLYWNLDQIVCWAETRDPEIVRIAAIPKECRPRTSLNLLPHYPHDALRLLGVDRDVEGELWATSGLNPKVREFVPPTGVREIAEQTGRPAYEIFDETGVFVVRPLSSAASKFWRAWMYASSSDRAKTTTLFSTRGDDRTRIVSDPQLTDLSSGLVDSIRTYVSAPEAHGPPHVFVREAFPTVKYLEHLFRSARLQAIGNLPGDPRALAINVSDWSGLEIDVGGNRGRMCVWRLGQTRAIGGGDFENVRVERNQVLREFPAEPPREGTAPSGVASDDDARAVIRAALDEQDGFIGQENGAEIVRRKFPKFPKKRAMQLVRELTGNDKPGPKGPRKNRARNRAG